MMETSRKESQFADVETASGDYAARFSGEAGAWLLDIQARGLLKLLGQGNGRTLLDVGGGHGQVASVLAENGWKVTILGSSPEAMGVSERLVKSGKVKYEVGNLLATGHTARSYDVVSSFRLLPHCDDWRGLIAELSRLSREFVIVDYPTYQSINFISDYLFKLKKRIEKNTRPYRLFTNREICESFSEVGFALDARFCEFFFPMVIHRVLKCPVLSSALEFIPRTLGLTCLLGSPVIVKMVPSKNG